MNDWERLFWLKVTRTDECWYWTAYKTPRGYGRYTINRTRKTVGAHRLSYELANGPIPKGVVVDHLCHQPSCVNPEHLRLTTHKQNMENRSGPSSATSSGVRGVFWHKRTRRWVAHVTHNRVNKYLGYFDSLKDAEAAVIAERNELFTHNDADRKAS